MVDLKDLERLHELSVQFPVFLAGVEHFLSEHDIEIDDFFRQYIEFAHGLCYGVERPGAKIWTNDVIKERIL